MFLISSLTNNNLTNNNNSRYYYNDYNDGYYSYTSTYYFGGAASFVFILYGIVGLLAFVALTRVRFYMRQKYSIPADCCADSGCLSDCCCMYWCSCCGVIQMLRHTHDERTYVYNCTSQTGLRSDVPEIV